MDGEGLGLFGGEVIGLPLARLGDRQGLSLGCPLDDAVGAKDHPIFVVEPEEAQFVGLELEHNRAAAFELSGLLMVSWWTVVGGVLQAGKQFGVLVRVRLPELVEEVIGWALGVRSDEEESEATSAG